jgi:hypothetical protein
MSIATPTPESNIESLLSTCQHCHQPVVSVKLDAGADWSDWAHALSGRAECDSIEPPPAQATDRAN